MMSITKKRGKFVVPVLLLLLLSNCTVRNTGEVKNADTDKGVECRLYYIGDSYPKATEEAEEDDWRSISLNYLIINNTRRDFFLPIKNATHREDSMYASEMRAYINKKPIRTWFSTNTNWKGILKPGDSIRADLKIEQWVLEKNSIDKRINLLDLLSMFEMAYNWCPSDTIYSKLPMPPLHFTRNDSVVIYYKEIDPKSTEVIY